MKILKAIGYFLAGLFFFGITFSLFFLNAILFHIGAL